MVADAVVCDEDGWLGVAADTVVHRDDLEAAWPVEVLDGVGL